MRIMDLPVTAYRMFDTGGDRSAGCWVYQLEVHGFPHPIFVTRPVFEAVRERFERSEERVTLKLSLEDR